MITAIIDRYRQIFHVNGIPTPMEIYVWPLSNNWFNPKKGPRTPCSLIYYIHDLMIVVKIGHRLVFWDKTTILWMTYTMRWQLDMTCKEEQENLYSSYQETTSLWRDSSSRGDNHQLLWIVSGSDRVKLSCQVEDTYTVWAIRVWSELAFQIAIEKWTQQGWQNGTLRDANNLTIVVIANLVGLSHILRQ